MTCRLELYVIVSSPFFFGLCLNKLISFLDLRVNIVKYAVKSSIYNNRLIHQGYAFLQGIMM